VNLTNRKDMEDDGAQDTADAGTDGDESTEEA
jgi:hypothetical protein